MTPMKPQTRDRVPEKIELFELWRLRESMPDKELPWQHGRENLRTLEAAAFRKTAAKLGVNVNTLRSRYARHLKLSGSHAELNLKIDAYASTPLATNMLKAQKALDRISK
jgi:hypothetical protein